MNVWKPVIKYIICTYLTLEPSICSLGEMSHMTFITEQEATDQTDSVAPAVRTMTKCVEQWRADTGVASWMAGSRRRPQEENTDKILSWLATARTSLRTKPKTNDTFSADPHNKDPVQSYLLPAAVTTELGSSVFQSRPSLEHRSWLSLEPATTDTSFSTSRMTDGSMLT